MFTIKEIKEMPIEERLKVLEMRAKLQKKKASVMGLVKRIPKNGFNAFHKYEYSTESDIKEGVRSLLSENGLTLDIEPISDSKVEVNTKQGKQWLHTVEMEFTLTDNDTGFMDIKTSKGEATDGGDKGIYKAYAGCIKYYLINNFLISTGEKTIDPEDGDSEQTFNKGNNKNNNKGGNNNNRSNNQSNNNRSNNAGGGNDRSEKPKASMTSIEAKWKQLNNGDTSGLDGYIKKKQGEGKDLDWIDQVLLGRIQSAQAQKKKEQDQSKPGNNSDKPEDFDNDLKALKQESDKNVNPPTVTDVNTGKTVEYQGKEITFE